MNIGIRCCCGILNQKYFRIGRIIRTIVYQCFYQDAVFNPNFLVEIEGEISVLEANHISFRLEFVAADITFIENGIVNFSMSQKIAARHI